MILQPIICWEDAVRVKKVPQPDLPRTQTFGTAKAKNLEFLADAFL